MQLDTGMSTGLVLCSQAWCLGFVHERRDPTMPRRPRLCQSPLASRSYSLPASPLWALRLTGEGNDTDVPFASEHKTLTLCRFTRCVLLC